MPPHPTPTDPLELLERGLSAAAAKVYSASRRRTAAAALDAAATGLACGGLAAAATAALAKLGGLPLAWVTAAAAVAAIGPTVVPALAVWRSRPRPPASAAVAERLDLASGDDSAVATALDLVRTADRSPFALRAISDGLAVLARVGSVDPVTPPAVVDRGRVVGRVGVGLAAIALAALIPARTATRRAPADPAGQTATPVVAGPPDRRPPGGDAVARPPRPGSGTPPTAARPVPPSVPTPFSAADPADGMSAVAAAGEGAGSAARPAPGRPQHPGPGQPSAGPAPASDAAPGDASPASAGPPLAPADPARSDPPAPSGQPAAAPPPGDGVPPGPSNGSSDDHTSDSAAGHPAALPGGGGKASVDPNGTAVGKIDRNGGSHAGGSGQPGDDGAGGNGRSSGSNVPKKSRGVAPLLLGTRQPDLLQGKRLAGPDERTPLPIPPVPSPAAPSPAAAADARTSPERPVPVYRVRAGDRPAVDAYLQAFHQTDPAPDSHGGEPP